MAVSLTTIIIDHRAFVVVGGESEKRWATEITKIEWDVHMHDGE